MKRPAVWITGAAGLIGHHLLRAAPADLDCIPLTRAELDLAHFSEVTRRFHRDHPTSVIHCAAISKAALCEANPGEARRVNIEATRHLCSLASDIPFFFLSTDLVFDGQKGNYVETDTVHPLTLYSETKVLAEASVLANPKHTVVRASLNYGCSPSGDRSFNEEMLLRWRRGESLRLFVDEFRCPVPVETTARAIWELHRQNQPGLYHLAGAERVSRWQLGQAIAAKHLEFVKLIVEASRQDYHGPPRPADTSLNCSKIQSLLPFPLPRIREWLAVGRV